MRRARLAAAAALLAAAGVAEAGTKRVLLLHSFGRDVEAHADFARQFRTALGEEAAEPIELYEISLAAALLQGGSAEPAFVQYLAAFESQSRFDLVVSLGGPATRFVQRHRGELFASSPRLIAATDARHVIASELAANDAAIPLRVDLAGAIENILRVQPETREVLVVFGASELERFWEDEFRAEASAFEGRVRFTYLSSLSFERILERVAAPSPGTAVFYGMMIRDTVGVPLGEDHVFAALSSASRAPVFGVWDFQVGKGAVGGPVVPLHALAVRSAHVAEQILAGASPSEFRDVPIGVTFAYDARALKRWGIPRSRLPRGSELVHDDPTFWELHRGTILLVVAIGLGQGALIVWLYASRRRVRRAEAEIRDVTGHIVAAQEEERARLARELHDDVTQRLARFAIDAGRSETSGADPETLRGLRDGLIRLSENVHALAYSLHPSLLDDLGIAEAIQVEAERVSAHSGIPVETQAERIPSRVPSGAARCVFRVAQEALRNVVRHSGAGRVRVLLRGEGRALSLEVRDDGVGFDPEAPRERPSLGLVSMRERVRLAGGTMTVDTAPGRGTTITVLVPLKEPPR